jgi:hypothetical protein
METDTHVQKVFPGSTLQPLKVVPTNRQSTDANAVHSENNILQWTEYLPDDCIKKMTEMGWDLTT